MQTQLNAKFKRIYSFAYYTPEIESLKEVELDSSTWDEMLAHRRRTWKRHKPEIEAKKATG